MDYFDFDLLLERSGNAYLARVVSSPAGQAETVFPFPFDVKDLEIFNLKIGQPRKGVRRVNSPEMELAQEYGTRLFKAVFGGEVYTSFRSSHDQARREGKGLRLQLRIKDQRLASLPWEYLYNPSLNRFLTLAVDTPVVRYLDLPEPVLPFPVTLPLKILAVITSPKDLPPLDVEGEWQRLNQALAPLTGRGAAQVDRLKIPTLSTLPSQLRSGGPYHILHFVGHGAFDERSQDGLLIFENEHGTSQPVNGQRLGTILHNHPSLRLAVLNACEGAHPAAEDPFAGVAHSLVQQGLPAVVAMQFAITDRAALIFSQEFYAAVAAGYPVDAALAEARVAIYADGNDIEWGTPVYFTRLPDGQIFNLAAVSLEKPAKEPVEQQALLAERAYEAGLSAFYASDLERASRDFQRAVSINPDHAQAAQKLKDVELELDLTDTYARAREKIKAADWAAAVELFEQVERKRLNYKDVRTLLAEARRQVQLAGLYADARRLLRQGNPQAVLSIFERLHSLDKTYPDPDGLLAAARQALAKTQRQNRLEENYRGALRAIEQRRWQAAEKLLRQVLSQDHTYRDAPQLLKRAEAERQARKKALVKPFDRLRRLPRFAYLTLAGLAGLAGQALCLALIWTAIRLGPLAIASLWPSATPIQTSPTSTRSSETTTAPTQTPKPPTFTPVSSETLTPSPTPTASPSDTPSTLAYPPEITQQAATMVLIPAGAFQMGCDPSNPAETCQDDEKRLHPVTLDAYYIDKYEVTNTLYQACEEAGECTPLSNTSSSTRSSYYGNPEFADYPVIYVSWEQARKYCEWRGARLPTEAEWEKAARGDQDTRMYPWGDQVADCTLANYSGCKNDTDKVGSYPGGASPYGMLDMAGNVWEWVNDWYNGNYYKASPASNPSGPETGITRVLRGGGWYNDQYGVRSAYRYNGDPADVGSDIGFRCASPPGPNP